MRAVKTLAREQEEMKKRWAAKRRRFKELEDGPVKVALAVELFGSKSKGAKAAQKAAERELGGGEVVRTQGWQEMAK